jgi:hypothetical protein
MLLHAAAGAGAVAGVWDLVGRGWALLVLVPVLLLFDIAAGDG